MSFFNAIFGNSETENELKKFWSNIKSESDLEEAIKKSFEKKIVIFKHSTRCYISKTVLRNFEKEIEDTDKDIVFYYLDLLVYRNLSNKIAEDLDIEHQSPQLIVLENGKVVRNASHHSITLNLV
jgi:bacillithiol system protein YtxJ